jgi:hypothetical protein
MSALTGRLDPSHQDGDETPVWVELPVGFAPLPTDDIDQRMATAETVLTELAPEQLKGTVRPVVGALTYFLHDLVARNALYCGIGHHLSAVDGSTVTSSLVVSLQRFWEERNPRLVLKDLLQTKLDAGDRGQSDLVDLANGPVLFFETTRVMPTPQLPGLPPVPDGSTTRIFQLEALVPSADGAMMAAIEFSTPFESYGPEFRTMIVTMAASVSFTEPTTGPRSISQVLNG